MAPHNFHNFFAFVTVLLLCTSRDCNFGAIELLYHPPRAPREYSSLAWRLKRAILSMRCNTLGNVRWGYSMPKPQEFLSTIEIGKLHHCGRYMKAPKHRKYHSVRTKLILVYSYGWYWLTFSAFVTASIARTVCHREPKYSTTFIYLLPFRWEWGK